MNADNTMYRVAVGVALAAAVVLLALIYLNRTPKHDVHPVAISSQAIARSTTAAEAHPGFLYGRITAKDGASYEGRLRFGRGEEAFWGDYFNGVKKENPWAAQVPAERLPKESHAFGIFGFKIAQHDRPSDLRRLFMARFGDIARIEAHGRDVRVILKSGTVFDLNRFDSSDFDDGVRVWDGTRGVVDLDSARIGTIEFHISGCGPQRSPTARSSGDSPPSAIC